MNPAIARRSLLTGLAASAAVVGSGSLFAAPRVGFFQRIGKPIGLQLYTLGEEPGRDLDGVFTKLAAIGYRDIELPGLLGHTPADIRAAADRTGLRITCIHLGLRAAPGGLLLTSDNQRIADTLGALGVHQAVLPMMQMPELKSSKPGETFQTVLARGIAAEGADVWKRTAGLLNERAAALKPFGIALGYHNHNVEFAPVGDTTGWDILVRETDPSLISFEVDLGWVAAAGLNPVEFLRRHSGRVRWVHVKDIKASAMPNFALTMVPAEVGSGRLDWSRILPAAHKAGCSTSTSSRNRRSPFLGWKPQPGPMRSCLPCAHEETSALIQLAFLSGFRCSQQSGILEMLLRSIAFLPVVLAGIWANTAVAQAAPGEQIFRQRCQACHAVAPNGLPGPLGPNLRGVVGRKAGATAFRNYSPALKGANITWTQANLDRFLSAPSQMVPGTRMVIAMPNPKDRSTLLVYLNSLR